MPRSIDYSTQQQNMSIAKRLSIRLDNYRRKSIFSRIRLLLTANFKFSKRVDIISRIMFPALV